MGAATPYPSDRLTACRSTSRISTVFGVGSRSGETWCLKIPRIKRMQHARERAAASDTLLHRHLPSGWSTSCHFTLDPADSCLLPELGAHDHLHYADQKRTIPVNFLSSGLVDGLCASSGFPTPSCSGPDRSLDYAHQHRLQQRLSEAEGKG